MGRGAASAAAPWLGYACGVSRACALEEALCAVQATRGVSATRLLHSDWRCPAVTERDGSDAGELGGLSASSVRGAAAARSKDCATENLHNALSAWRRRNSSIPTKTPTLTFAAQTHVSHPPVGNGEREPIAVHLNERLTFLGRGEVHMSTVQTFSDSWKATICPQSWTFNLQPKRRPNQLNSSTFLVGNWPCIGYTNSRQLSRCTPSWVHQCPGCASNRQASWDQFKLPFSTATETAPGARVSSPLLATLTQSGAGAKGVKSTESKRVKAKLSGIKQGARKVNLVAALIRGMSVSDALDQLAVMHKRAARTVSKVVHAARANAAHNHGLNASNLVIAEAFVGRDACLRRSWPHGKGKAGVRTRYRCQLTVLVRPQSAAEMEKRALASGQRTRRSTWRAKLKKLELRALAPHRLVEVGTAKSQGAALSTGGDTSLP